MLCASGLFVLSPKGLISSDCDLLFFLLLLLLKMPSTDELHLLAASQFPFYWPCSLFPRHNFTLKPYSHNSALLKVWGSASITAAVMQSVFVFIRNVATRNLSNRMSHSSDHNDARRFCIRPSILLSILKVHDPALLWMFEVNTKHRRAAPLLPNQCFRNCHEYTSKSNGPILLFSLRFSGQPPILSVHVHWARYWGLRSD